MNEYLVTKYDPKYRVNGIGIYTRDEWSDICDIGREFEDGVLTREEYEDMVKRYSACAVDILKRANAERMIVSSCEDINNKACRKENDIVSLCEVGRIVRDCLNGDYWCILTDRRSFVHIGDCLYMYIGCDLAPDEVSEICRRYGMFVIERESPYKHIGELIDWMLRDPTIEDQILEKCEKGNKEYICEHFDGELREEKLYAYCVHAKKNKRAQEILLQVVQFADQWSFSMRVLEALSALPKRVFRTACHHLAHCDLRFLQTYTVFQKCQIPEMLIDMLNILCTQKQYTEDDISFLMEQVNEIDMSVIKYFVDSFDEKTPRSVKKKLKALKAIVYERKR